MTPEERAKVLLVYMSRLPDVPDVDATIAVFAQAIRDAEDAALERAAAIADARNVGGRGGDDYETGGYAVAADICDAIRELKSKQET